MAAVFTIGEQKTRPGVYFRYENYGAPPLAGAEDGRCAVVLRSNWGPVGQVVPLESAQDVTKIFGDGGLSGGTTDAALEAFRGGAGTVFAVRLGNGGTAGTYQIADTADTPVLQLNLLYPGSRTFSLAIRPTLADPNVGELLLLEGTTTLERFAFDITSGADQVSGLLAAVSEKGSAFFTLSAISGGGTALKTINQAAITPGGDPASYTPADYSAAFEALEAHRWNTLAVDTSDAAVHLLMQAYLERIWNDGRRVMGVVGESVSVPFETRLAHASAFNDYRMVYVGSGFIDTAGVVCESWRAAARIAGLIAGTPSSESITHVPLAGAVSLTETLSNYRHEQAIKAGMLTFSVSAANTVWVEQGINTLVMPGTTEDAGWKKIKRVKVRYELMQRINDTVEGLIGRINNDPDGRMTIIQSGNGVCNAMVAEGKLLSGAHCKSDPDNLPAGDSAWFLVFADDVDALEKMYFAFKFRFAPEG